MLVYRIIIPGLVLTIAVLAVASIAALTSLWLTWSLLPAEPRLAVALNRTRPGSVFLEQIEQVEELAGYLPVDLLELRRFSYGQYQDNQILVAMPRLAAARAVQQKLISSGWHVERLGFILRASSSPAATQTQPTLMESLVATGRYIVSKNLPTAPLAIASASPGVWPGIDSGVQAIADFEGSQLRMKAVFDQSNLADRPFSKISPIPPSSDELSFVLPTAFFGQLPSGTLEQWDELLQQKLALTKTRPDIMTELIQHDHIIVSIIGEQTAIGVRGQPDRFLANLRTWLEAEDAFKRPVRQPFRLPDNSLGYQYVPNETRPLFTPNVDQDGCLEPLVDRNQLWLCHQGQAAIIATSRQTALELLAANSNQWHLRLGVNHSGKLGLPNVAHLSASGQTGYADLHIGIQ